MANIIDENGLTTKTLLELRTELIAGMKEAYGDDINTDQDTPDGQAINIFALAVKDVLDLLTQVYNSFDPDLAIGRVLDQRVAINGIQRLEGTHTTTSVKVEVDRAINLVGLDLLEATSSTFTIADTAGNLFYLKDSISLSGAGFYDLIFKAAIAGPIDTSAGTLTKISSVVLGVKSVTNSDVMNTTLGTSEETDAALRLRRQKSVSLASQGYLSSLKAALKNISGVTYSEVYENNSSVVDSDLIPAHCIWVIVEGGESADIAYEIYTKRNAGCQMKGDISESVTQPDGTFFEIKFDRTVTENFYLKFDASSISGVALDAAYIKTQIVANINLDVNESLNVNDIAYIIRSVDSNCLATNILLSKDNSNWFSILSPSLKNKRMILTTGNIDITLV